MASCCSCRLEIKSGSSVSHLRCGHSYHVTCLHAYMSTPRSTCPECKHHGRVSDTLLDYGDDIDVTSASHKYRTGQSYPKLEEPRRSVRAGTTSVQPGAAPGTVLVYERDLGPLPGFVETFETAPVWGPVREAISRREPRLPTVGDPRELAHQGVTMQLLFDHGYGLRQILSSWPNLTFDGMRRFLDLRLAELANKELMPVDILTAKPEEGGLKVDYATLARYYTFTASDIANLNYSASEMAKLRLTAANMLFVGLNRENVAKFGFKPQEWAQSLGMTSQMFDTLQMKGNDVRMCDWKVSDLEEAFGKQKTSK